MRRPSGTSEMPRSTRRGAESDASDSPAYVIVPDRAGTSPAIALRRVDFPAPFAPMIDTVSAASTWMSMPNSAWKSP